MQLLLVQVVLLLTTAVHPFFISICQINHNARSKTLEMAVKIFTSDLETALEAQGSGSLNLGTPREAGGADEIIAAYLNREMEIKVNGQVAKGTFIGKEVEMDVIWCYMEYPNITDVREFDMTNRLLMEQFESQTNIVHITVNGVRKSMMMQAGRTHDSVLF
jgi:hypothetical protein